ncbi:MAG: carbohydrate-binding domain-containing protein [Candidatus Bathyarchaeota archaeon]|nr:carbohydrate-binding domain-containing protein [Candidatus Bathyarchaeota archaeon]
MNVNKKILIVFVLCTCLAASFVTYQFMFATPASQPNQPKETDHSSNATLTPTATPTNNNPSSSPTDSSSNSPTTNPTPIEVPINTDEPPPPHVNEADHEEAADYVWNEANVVDVTLNGNSITVSNSSVATVTGGKVTITSAGTYRLKGSLTNGQVIVNTADKATVRLLLNNVNIYCSNSAPIFVMDAKKTVIILEAGTQNNITDGSSYTVNAEGEPKGAIFCKSDLTIYGAGALTVQANYNDGISSNDGLILGGGQISVTSVGDAARGKDYVVVKEGNINLNAGKDGLKSDSKDATRGYITIKNGVLQITAGEDAINAQSDFLMQNGQITAYAGGGSSNNVVQGVSTKGIKAIVELVIDGGTFTIDTSDDAIHSNGTITINSGIFNLKTNDDAMHADDSLVINNGDIAITKCFEGLESANVTINNGNIHIVSRDDGINVAGGRDGSGFTRPGWGGDTFGSGNYHLFINGGYIYVNSGTDGLDSNGDIIMTGGKVIVDGPTTDMESAIDHDFPPPRGYGGFKMTGGWILAVGSAGMAVGPNSSSTQNSVLFEFSSSKSGGTLLHLRTSGGAEIFTFKPVKMYKCFVFSSPDLKQGTTYEVYTGGSTTGTAVDGLYSGGTYTPGTKANPVFTITNVVTSLRKTQPIF